MKQKCSAGFTVCWFVSALVVLIPTSTKAVSCSSSPIVLDLEGDGIRTTDLFEPVVFDLFGSGQPVRTGWTREDAEDSFLWLDLDRNGQATNGRELFGDSTPLPMGGVASNGFEALKAYDSRDLGGNEDGRISSHDAIWSSLLLWTDKDHDGISSRSEIRSLGDVGVESIGLTYREEADVDGVGNWHFLKSEFALRVEAPWGEAVVTRGIEDIYFRYERITSP